MVSIDAERESVERALADNAQKCLVHRVACGDAGDRAALTCGDSCEFRRRAL